MSKNKKWNEWTFYDWWKECEFTKGEIESMAAWGCQQVIIDWQASRIKELEKIIKGSNKTL